MRMIPRIVRSLRGANGQVTVTSRHGHSRLLARPPFVRLPRLSLFPPLLPFLPLPLPLLSPSLLSPFSAPLCPPLPWVLQNPRDFLITVHALMDFCYLGLAPETDNDTCGQINYALDEFHANK